MVPGKRYGRLTCLERFSIKPVRWTFRCDCGWEGVKNHHQVIAGGVQSCGCQVGRSQAEDLTGQTFGDLTVLSLSDDFWVHVKTGKKRVKWHCRCSCGTELDVLAMSLKGGNTASCGCLTKGDDSIGAWIEGSFRTPESDCFFYVYGLANHPELAKPGIAQDLQHREDEEYGELYDFIALPRLDAWLIEQAVLWQTRADHFCPGRLLGWDGASELRVAEPETLFKQALYFADELERLGRVEFAIRYLRTLARHRKALKAMLRS